MTMHPNDIRVAGDNNALRASSPLYPGSAHVNAALSDFASSYSNGTFHADRVSPIFLVDAQSDTFHKFSQKDAITELDNAVGDRGELSEVTLESTTGSYQCLGYGLRGPVTRALQNTADPAVKPKERTTKSVQARNMLCREIRVATQYQTSGNYAASSTAAATAVWSDTVSGVPVTDVEVALEGMPASDKEDTLLIGICALEVFNDLIAHPQMRDLHGTTTGKITAEIAASYLGLDELLVSTAQKNTANTGQAVVVARVWAATSFVITRVPRALQSTDQEMFGCTFRRRLEGAADGILAREWHEAGRGTEGTDHVAVTHEDDEVIIQNNQGFLITSVRS